MADGMLVAKFPSDLTQKYNKWCRFDAMLARHVGRHQLVTPENSGGDPVVACVALYLPASALKSSLDVVYEETVFTGALWEMQGQTATHAMAADINTTDALDATTGDMLINMWKPMYAAAMSGGLTKTAIEWGKKVALGGFGVVDDKMLSALAGQQANPRTDVIFKNQQYRNWTFDYVMVPRNQTEADDIDKIVQFFQFYMLPSYLNTAATKAAKVGAFMMGFPYEFIISVYGNELDMNMQLAGKNAGLNPAAGQLQHIEKIERVVLESISVDHAAGGKTAFVNSNGGLYPVATSMSLKFQEVVLLGRDSTNIASGRGGYTPADPKK